MTQLAAEQPINPEAIKYINRLSDHLFVLARRLNDNGATDVLWVPGGSALGAFKLLKDWEKASALRFCAVRHSLDMIG